MSAQKRTPSSALGAFFAFIGMSVVAGLLVAAAVTPAIAVTGMAANQGIAVFDGLPSFLKIDQLAQRTVLTAAGPEGKQVELATFFAQNREEVPWDQVSQAAKDAAVAAEDVRFYEHGGIDLVGTVRALFSTVVDKDVQGGSSITQQLVKNVLIQQCETKLTVRPAPNPDNVPDEPDKSKFPDEAAYNKALDEYKETKANYDKALKAHKSDEAKYETCLEDARGITPERKLREMKYAIGLEKQYSKDQILLKYLNIAGFGGSVYGIQAAAQYYYGIDAKDLNVAQAASLIAITNNPYYLKLDDPESKTNGAENGYAENKKRRDYIIDQMYQYKKITKEQHDEAIATKIEPKITPQPRGCQTAGANAFFCDYITWVIKNDPTFGKDQDTRWNNFLRGGYHIQTTLDLQLQQVSQDALTAQVPPSTPGVNLGATSIAVQPGTGKILTMVQSRPFANDPDFLQAHPGEYTAVNWNTDRDYGGSSGFQPGSTYKIFTLADWLKTGHSLQESVNSSEHYYPASDFTNSCGGTGNPNKPYRVSNDQGEGGVRTVLNGTKFSVNTVFMQMATQLDLCDIKKTAQDFGVHTATGEELMSSPSSVIGAASTVSPLTMATAVAAVAANGKVCTPIAIEKITGPEGKEIDPPKSTCTTAVDPQVAAAMAYAMHATTVSGGTVVDSNPFDGTPLIGKTGTTDDAKDTWVTIASTKVAIATWVGNVTGFTNLRDYRLNGKYTAGLRHQITEPIMAAADAKYGGDPFPDASSKYLVGVQVAVPDLTGKSPAEAEKILKGIGLDYRDGGARDGMQPAGTVMATEPGPGTNVSKGTPITVYTSNGVLKQLPDVTGKSEADARAELAAAGFANVTSTPKATGDADKVGIVLSQKPGGGPVNPSTEVKLTIGVAKPGGGGGGPGGGGPGHP